ncbi:hypothetical protein DSECCO2_468040 [anaerobic digester metagenome]
MGVATAGAYRGASGGTDPITVIRCRTWVDGSGRTVPQFATITVSPGGNRPWNRG